MGTDLLQWLTESCPVPLSLHISFPQCSSMSRTHAWAPTTSIKVLPTKEVILLNARPGLRVPHVNFDVDTVKPE